MGCRLQDWISLIKRKYSDANTQCVNRFNAILNGPIITDTLTVGYLHLVLSFVLQLKEIGLNLFIKNIEPKLFNLQL